MCAVGWLMWYVPVAGALVIAYLYARWTQRPRGPQEPTESVQAYERFRQVMAAPLPVQRTRENRRLRALSRR